MRVGEIHFWRNQVEDGCVMEALRKHRKRAERFFGVNAVQSEDEAEIYRTLEANELLTLPEKEIMSIMNRVPDSLIEDINNFAPDVQIEIKKLPRFSSEDVKALKAQALKHMKRVFPKQRSSSLEG